jgi:hypothetical protein
MLTCACKIERALQVHKAMDSTRRRHVAALPVKITQAVEYKLETLIPR